MDIKALYQEVIMDHARKPRNYGEVEHADVYIYAENPMCGDNLTIYLMREGSDTIRSTHFTGSACSICMASASLMTVKTRGMSFDEARKLSEKFQRMIVADEANLPEDLSSLGDLQALEGVRKFPMRAKCATLAWHALDDAIEAALGGEHKREVTIDGDAGEGAAK